MPATKTRRRARRSTVKVSVSYTWAEGSMIKLPASSVGKQLEKIAKEHGTVTPEQVIESAKPKNSVLHPHFEWNDKKAGAEFRKSQAGHLIRCIRVISHFDGNEPKRAFIHVRVKGSRKGQYHPREEVISRKELADAAIKECVSQLWGIRKRFEEVRALQSVFNAIDEAYEKYIK